MSWTFSYSVDSTVVIVETHGEYSALGGEQMVRELQEQLDKFGCTRALVDHRDADITFKFMDIFDRPNLYNSIGLTRNTKVALVFRELKSDYTFFETVCVNRGYKWKVFISYDLAMKWLIS
ncbi:MAG: hypothetical protein ACHQQQ_00120 [Bacteroidota bacterium]